MRALGFAAGLAGLLGAPYALGAVQPTWSLHAGLGSPGANGIVILDLDGDGRDEAVVTAYAVGLAPAYAAQFLAVLQQVDGELRIPRVARLPAGESLVGAIHSLPATAAEPARVFATVERERQHHLIAFAGADLARLGEPLALPAGFQLKGIADVDGDGAAEFYGVHVPDSLSGGRPQVRDLVTGVLEWEDAARASLELSAGQLDGDAALELVYGSHVVDGASHVDAWSAGERFRGPAVFGNFDDDAATREFAVVEPNGMTRVFATSPQFAPLGAHPTGEVSAFAVADVDADGRDEIVVGEGQWGAVIGYRPGDWSRALDFPHPDHGVSALAFGDLDGDPSLEVVFGASVTITGPAVLTVFDAASRQIQYTRSTEHGPFSAVLADDFDGDGRLEVGHGMQRYDERNVAPRFTMLDARSGAVRRRVPDFQPWSVTHDTRLLTAQLDADPQLEILTGDGMLNHFVAADSLSLNRQWFAIADGSTIDAIGVAGGDVVAFAGGRLFAVDGATGAARWNSASFANAGRAALHAADIDADPALEVLVATATHLYGLDTATRAVERSVPLQDAAMAVHVEGTGTNCRVVLVHADRLARRRCDTFAPDSERALATATAHMVRFLDDSYGRLVVSDGTRVFSQDGAQIVRESTSLGPQLGWRDFGAVHATADSLTVFVGDVLGLHRIDLIDPRIWGHGFE